jgi:hypothetical protein
MLAERYGGGRALARAMTGKDGRNYEPTVRRWLSLDPLVPRSIIELNRIVARLSKFSRTEIKKSRRRIHRVAGPAGDRQAIFAHISLLSGYGRPSYRRRRRRSRFRSPWRRSGSSPVSYARLQSGLERARFVRPEHPLSCPSTLSQPSEHLNTS